MHELEAFVRLEQGGFRLHVRDLRSGRLSPMETDKLVLSAGTLNSLRLLLQAQEKGNIGPIPGLGRRFTVYGDLLGSWELPVLTDDELRIGMPSPGRVKIKGYETPSYFALGAGEPLPVPKVVRRLAYRRAAKKNSIVATFQDAADGEIWLESGRLKFACSMSGSDGFRSSAAAFDALAEQSGKLVSYDRETVLTAHPLGGCCPSDDPSCGVVDRFGEVHNNPGLYVADGSTLPGPTGGGASSLSIASWASHVAQGIAQKHATKPDHQS